jgi:UDP-N-acetylmuramyl pentapeptide phosphotransferase/UDP-N-acetylglucosamine-1-phosphate transferase
VVYLFSLAVSIVVAWLICRDNSILSVKDEPDERSLHSRPTPRLGGLAILAGSAAGWSWLVYQNGLPEVFIYISGAALLVAVISLADDFLTLSQAGRFVVHLLASAAVIYATVYAAAGIGMLLFYLIATLWLINLYNFMDGMDGFSGGMAAIGFAALAVAAQFSQKLVMAEFMAVIAVAACGFLLFNFPPARMFMGDVGSATIGFLVAAFSLWGVRDAVFPIWLPLLVFSPFIVDASLTILRRAINREKIWLPHRKHFYQRLVLNGWSHRRTVLCEYVLMLACAGSALLMQRYDLAVPGLAVWAVIYSLLAILVERKVRDKIPFCKEKEKNNPQSPTGCG